MWERGSCFYLSNYKANGWLNYWSDRSRSDWSCCSFEQWTDGVHVSTLVEQSHFFFYQNIADLKSIIGNNILKNERVIVFICTSATKATLSELVYENGKGVQKTLKNYDYPDPTYTTAEGITSILNDVQTYAPAKRYAMIIGCHGMGWIPVSRAVSRSSLQISKKHWEYEHALMTRFLEEHKRNIKLILLRLPEVFRTRA